MLAVVGLWLRSSLAESPRFLEIGDHARVPFAEVVRNHWRLLLLTGGGLAIGYAIFYAVMTWSLAYGTERLGVSRSVMLTCIMGAVLVKGTLTPLMALLGTAVAGGRCAWPVLMLVAGVAPGTRAGARKRWPERLRAPTG